MTSSGRSPAARRIWSTQSGSAVETTVKSGNRADRASAPFLLRTALTTFRPRRRAAIVRMRATEDPAAVKRIGVSRPAFGDARCAARSNKRAITAFGSSWAAMASGRSSGMGVTKSARVLRRSAQAPGQGLKITRAPGFRAGAASARAPTASTMPTPSPPGTRPPAGSGMLNRPRIMARLPGWSRRLVTRTTTSPGPGGCGSGRVFNWRTSVGSPNRMATMPFMVCSTIETSGARLVALLRLDKRVLSCITFKQSLNIIGTNGNSGEPRSLRAHGARWQLFRSGTQTGTDRGCSQPKRGDAGTQPRRQALSAVDAQTYAHGRRRTIPGVDRRQPRCAPARHCRDNSPQQRARRYLEGQHESIDWPHAYPALAATPPGKVPANHA